MKVKLFEREKELIWNVFTEKDKPVSKYIFKYKHYNYSFHSYRIMILSLLRYCILDIMGADSITIYYPMTYFDLEYLDFEISSLKKIIDVNISTINCYEKILFNINNYAIFSLDSCSLGFSGGKDSVCCLELLKIRYKYINCFRFNFDDEEFTKNFYSTMSIENEYIYKSISTKNLFEKNSEKYYQEEDMHVIYAASIFSQVDTYNALAVGLPWEFLHQNHNKKEKYVIAESIPSILNFEKLVKNYGFKKFKIFSPIAGLNSFAVYYLLTKIFDSKKLLELNSCWFPTKDGNPCGSCLKCKRVDFIYKILQIIPIDDTLENYIKKIESNYSISFLFGSLTMECFLKEYVPNNSTFYKEIYLDSEIDKLDMGFSLLIAQKYSFNIIRNIKY